MPPSILQSFLFVTWARGMEVIYSIFVPLFDYDYITIFSTVKLRVLIFAWTICEHSYIQKPTSFKFSLPVISPWAYHRLLLLHVVAEQLLQWSHILIQDNQIQKKALAKSSIRHDQMKAWLYKMQKWAIRSFPRTARFSCWWSIPQSPWNI